MFDRASRPGPHTDHIALWRLLFVEFLSTDDPQLRAEIGLEKLPERLAQLLGTSPDEAISTALSTGLKDVNLLELKGACVVQDMRVTSQTAATVAAELKADDISYSDCINKALCYSVVGMTSQAFSALRAAAAKADHWAQHHYIYGLTHGIQGNRSRALWELDLALRHEPYEEGRVRIRQARALIDPSTRN